MGLSVTFYENTARIHADDPGHPEESCYDEHVVVWVSDFPVQADGIPNRSCWASTGTELNIDNSYSGYGRYRAWLSMAALGVDPETVWSNPDGYRDRPFYSQINFADNEGTIGPKTSRLLADEYAENRAEVLRRMNGMPRQFDVTQADHDATRQRMIRLYDEWAAGFALAADTGMVEFA